MQEGKVVAAVVVVDAQLCYCQCQLLLKLESVIESIEV